MLVDIFRPEISALINAQLTSLSHFWIIHDNACPIWAKKWHDWSETCWLVNPKKSAQLVAKLPSWSFHFADDKNNWFAPLKSWQELKNWKETKNHDSIKPAGYVGPQWSVAKFVGNPIVWLATKHETNPVSWLSHALAGSFPFRTLMPSMIH